MDNYKQTLVGELLIQDREKKNHFVHFFLKKMRAYFGYKTSNTSHDTVFLPVVEQYYYMLHIGANETDLYDAGYSTLIQLLTKTISTVQKDPNHVEEVYDDMIPIVQEACDDLLNWQQAVVFGDFKQSDAA